MYRTLLGISLICLFALTLRAEDAKHSTENVLSPTTEPSPTEEEQVETADESETKPFDEVDDLELRDQLGLHEYDDPFIAEYLSRRHPRLGDKMKRMKRAMPFASDDELAHFFRFMPDEAITEHLASMEENSDSAGPAEPAEMMAEHGHGIVNDNDLGGLEDELMKSKHPGMRRLHQYYDGGVDDDEEIDEEKLFADQFPSREEMSEKSRLEMDELYKKMKNGHHHHHGPNRRRP